MTVAVEADSWCDARQADPLSVGRSRCRSGTKYLRESAPRFSVLVGPKFLFERILPLRQPPLPPTGRTIENGPAPLAGSKKVGRFSDF